MSELPCSSTPSRSILSRSKNRGRAARTLRTPPFHLHPLYRVTHLFRDLASVGRRSTYAKPRHGGGRGGGLFALLPRPSLPPLPPRPPLPPPPPRPTTSLSLSESSPPLPSPSRRKNGDSGFSRRTSTDRTSPNGAKRARSSSSRSSRGKPPMCSRVRGCVDADAIAPATDPLHRRRRLLQIDAEKRVASSEVTFGTLQMSRQYPGRDASRGGARGAVRLRPSRRRRRGLGLGRRRREAPARGARAGWWCRARDDGLGTFVATSA